MQDTQTKMFEITQDVTLNKLRAADKATKLSLDFIKS